MRIRHKKSGFLDVRLVFVSIRELVLRECERLQSCAQAADGGVFLAAQGTMVMLKISAFLVAYALVICQMYCSQAAPAR